MRIPGRSSVGAAERVARVVSREVRADGEPGRVASRSCPSPSGRRRRCVPSSSASSSSLTKTPRSPISPNGPPAVAVAGGRDRDERDLAARAPKLLRRERRPGSARAGCRASRRRRSITRRRLVEPEQVAHGLGVAAAVGAGGRLLQAHRRQVEQLVDDLRGDRLDCRLLRPPRARAAPAALELGCANLLRPRAQRRDRRDDLARGLPLAEAARPPRRRSPRRAPPHGDGRRGSRRPPTRGRRCRRGSSRRARGSPDRGRAARRGRSGTAAGPCGCGAPPRRSSRVSTQPGAPVDADDDVDLAERGRQRASSETASPPKRPASSRARVCGERLATNAIDAPRAARLRAASSATCPAPDEQHAAAVEVAEHLLGERGRGRRDGCGALADRRLGAHLLPGVQRLAEQAVEHRPRSRRPRTPPAPGRGSRPRPAPSSRARRRRGRGGAPPPRRASR